MYNPMCIIMQGEMYLVIFFFFFFNSGQATDLNLFLNIQGGLRSVLFATVSSTTFWLIELMLLTK